MVYLILVICVLYNYCFLYDDFDEDYFLDNDDDRDDGNDDVCDGCVLGG